MQRGKLERGLHRAWLKRVRRAGEHIKRPNVSRRVRLMADALGIPLRVSALGPPRSIYNVPIVMPRGSPQPNHVAIGLGHKLDIEYEPPIKLTYKKRWAVK